MMRNQGFYVTKEMLERKQNKDDTGSLKQVPFNKVSLYQEQNKDKGNATLLLEFNGAKPWPS